MLAAKKFSQGLIIDFAQLAPDIVNRGQISVVHDPRKRCFVYVLLEDGARVLKTTIYGLIELVQFGHELNDGFGDDLRPNAMQFGHRGGKIT